MKKKLGILTMVAVLGLGAVTTDAAIVRPNARNAAPVRARVHHTESHYGRHGNCVNHKDHYQGPQYRNHRSHGGRHGHGVHHYR